METSLCAFWYSWADNRPQPFHPSAFAAQKLGSKILLFALLRLFTVTTVLYIGSLKGIPYDFLSRKVRFLADIKTAYRRGDKTKFEFRVGLREINARPYVAKLSKICRNTYILRSFFRKIERRVDTFSTLKTIRIFETKSHSRWSAVRANVGKSAIKSRRPLDRQWEKPQKLANPRPKVGKAWVGTLKKFFLRHQIVTQC